MQLETKNISEMLHEVINNEVMRLVNQFGKAYLDCDDLMKLTGLGKDNVRSLMHSREFPVLEVGKRKIVSVVHFVIWQVNQYA